MIRINSRRDLSSTIQAISSMSVHSLQRNGRMTMPATILFVLTGIALAGCGADPRPDDPARHADTPHAQEKKPANAEPEESSEETAEVSITPAMMKESGVTVGSVMEGPVTAAVSAPGRVVPTQNGIAHVGTVIAGRITRLFVSEGSSVGKGAALAEIESFGISEVKGAYLRARAETERTDAALKRNTKLSGEGIGAGRVLEESRAAYRQAVAAQSEAETKLRAFGIDPADLHGSAETARSFSSRIVLRSPIAGVISRRAVVLGEFIEPSTDVFEVMNTGTIWVDAQVQPQSASELRIGGVGFAGEPNGEPRAGRIIFIAPSVDPATRTVTVRIELSNAGNRFRPETFVTVEFETSVTGLALTVPAEALEQDADKFYLYREREPNIFERVEVEPGPRTAGSAVIRNGVKKGDRIATGGIFYLKSIRQKAELQDAD
ncbi:MAG: Membrane-fusion protein [Chlorobi bacterium]|nr:Membrane-fusion protein [Chlorobiota bacterium]